MARCPFAVWQPISGSSGPHVGGPYKIVHHTTEGSSATGALAAFAQNKSDPHFTVDATRILQHIDTAEGARALRNATWDAQSGHYGHCHVPENSHWDPGYTASELAFIMRAAFDAEGRLVSPAPGRAPRKAPAKRGRSKAPAGAPRSTMPDHGVVEFDPSVGD